MTTHAELAAMRPTAAGPLLLARTARVVAYPAIRNRGTLGGSVALADPAADYPVALLACGALVEISSATEKRQVAAKDFFIGLFETALRAGEIVTALTIPSGPRGAGAAYAKLSLVAGDFAIVSVAAIGRAGADVELAVGGCGPVPQRIVTQGPDDAALLTAGRILAAASQPTSDHRASAAYRRRVIPELVRRAGRAALEQAT